METCSVVLTFESVDEILWCDYSNETSLKGIFSRYHFFLNIFYKMKFGIFLIFWGALLGVKKESFLVNIKSLSNAT